jgi:hypothetical protein
MVADGCLQILVRNRDARHLMKATASRSEVVERPPSRGEKRFLWHLSQSELKGQRKARGRVETAVAVTCIDLDLISAPLLLRTITL